MRVRSKRRLLDHPANTFKNPCSSANVLREVIPDVAPKRLAPRSRASGAVRGAQGARPSPIRRSARRLSVGQRPTRRASTRPHGYREAGARRGRGRANTLPTGDRAVFAEVAEPPPLAVRQPDAPASFDVTHVVSPRVGLPRERAQAESRDARFVPAPVGPEELDLNGIRSGADRQWQVVRD